MSLAMNILLLAVRLGGYLSFNRARRSVQKTQEKLLNRIILKNKESRFGREHDFSSIESVSSYRSKVPVSTFDSYLADVDSILNGEKNVLTKEPVLFLQPSSGSTAESKYIPFTKSLKNEFLRGIRPWFFDLFVKRRRLLGGKAYWSISPAGSKLKKAGVKPAIGFDDSEYFSLAEKTLLKLLSAVPLEIQEVQDFRDFKYVSLLFLLKEKSLTFISVWNPTFLTILLEDLLSWSDNLVSDIGDGRITGTLNIDEDLKKKLTRHLKKDAKRAEELRGIFRQAKGPSISGGKALHGRIWPHLAVISCWADGNASRHIKEIKEIFPNVEIQPKGLLATEAFVSFPVVGDEGSALAVNSHFFEFIEIEKEGGTTGGDTKLAHELEAKRSYSPVITTGGGLYRYHLQDIIEVLKVKNGLAFIRFIGKSDNVSDLMGEKLNALHVESVLAEVIGEHDLEPEFFMMAPEKDERGRYYYTFFIKSPEKSDECLLAAAGEIEKKLSGNFHYGYSRKLDQLGRVRIFVIEEDSASSRDKYLMRQVREGRKAGDIKPMILERSTGWSEVFKGRFIGV